MTHEQRARQIVTEAFADKKDKAGRPYIEHLEAVCRMVESDEDEVKAIALLHDLMEDCEEEWPFDRIESIFNYRIALGCSVLDRFPSSYSGYIERIKRFPDAVLVKLADLRHNMDVTRLPTLGEYEIQRLRKYHAAYLELMEFKNTWK